MTTPNGRSRKGEEGHGMYSQCRIALRKERRLQIKIKIYMISCKEVKLWFVGRKYLSRTIAVNMAIYTVFCYGYILKFISSMKYK